MNKAVRKNGRGEILLVEGISIPMLKLWALQNTKGKATTYVCDSNNLVLYMVQGRGRDLPKVISHFEEDLYIELGI